MEFQKNRLELSQNDARICMIGHLCEWNKGCHETAKSVFEFSNENGTCIIQSSYCNKFEDGSSKNWDQKYRRRKSSIVLEYDIFDRMR